MKCINRTFLYIAFVGFIGIQFASILDDPQHLVEPDPDCPICLAAKTQVYLTPRISVSFTPDIIYYLIEKAPFNQEKENCSSIISIRRLEWVSRLAAVISASSVSSAITATLPVVEAVSIASIFIDLLRWR